MTEVQSGEELVFDTQPGWITDKVLLLGNEKIAQYLIAGDQYALVGGGVAWNVALFERQLDEFEIDRGNLRYLIVTHIHHDHCGMLPYLLRRYPQLEVVASPYGTHLLGKPEVARLMRELNDKTLKAMGLAAHYEGVELAFHPVEGVQAMPDGAEIFLGEDAVLRFLLTPGHSRCSMSVYMPGQQVLFPGDAMPLRAGPHRKLAVAANHDFNDYIDSLEKIRLLPILSIAYEHGGVMLGEAANGEAKRGLEAARAERERIRQKYEELGDMDRLIDVFTKKYQELELFGQIDRKLLAAILGRMLRSALGKV